MLPEFEGVVSMLEFISQQMKSQLVGLDKEALNWKPDDVPETNSIYGIVVHAAINMPRILAYITEKPFSLGVPEEDEQTACGFVGESSERLIDLLDKAIAVVKEGVEQVTLEDLEGVIEGRTLPKRWRVQLLIHHTSNHLGHIELTRQLYQNRQHTPVLA